MKKFLKKIISFLIIFCIAFSSISIAKTSKSKKSGKRAASASKKAGKKKSSKSSGKRFAARRKTNKTQKKQQYVAAAEEEENYEEESYEDEVKYSLPKIEAVMFKWLECLRFGGQKPPIQLTKSQAAKNLKARLIALGYGDTYFFGAELCHDEDLKQYFNEIMNYEE